MRHEPSPAWPTSWSTSPSRAPDWLPTTREVSDAIEGVGGSSNAATDRETTVYWTRLPIREAELGVRVLSELTLHPKLRSEDIAHEREIIIDEIKSYRDDPAQFIHNVWDEAWFGDTPLGWEIAGDETSVRSLTDEDIRNFWAASYRPSNMVVALAGDIGHDDAVELVERTFGRGNGAVPSYLPAPEGPLERMRLEHRHTAQAHVVLGLPGLPRDHARPVDAGPAQHRARRRHLVAPVHEDPRGGGHGLRRALVPDGLR